MASTIKLKNSNTAGNAPSSLEQGEVAINVADGNLFYGDGSSVLQNFALNNITASGVISASGNIFGDSIRASSGFVGTITTAAQPNITSVGTLTGLNVNGNITGSNISSSATIIGNIISGSTISGSFVGDGSGISGITVSNENLTVDNATLQLDSGTTFDGSAAKTISIKDGGVDSDALAANITVTQLTASFISSSETVFTTNIATPDIPSGNQTGTPITIKAGRGFGSGATAGALFLRTSQGMGTGLGGDITLQPGGGGSAVEAKSGSINLNSTKININGPVTASGDISASGTIFGGGLNINAVESTFNDGNISNVGTIQADNFAGDINSDHKLQITSDALDLRVDDTSILELKEGQSTFSTNITASGNISSSGNVAGLSGSFSRIVLENNSRIVAKNSPSTTYIELQNDDGFQFRANNTEVFTVFSNGAVFNDLGVAQADFRIESDNDTHIFFVDSGNDKVAIGTDTVGSSLLTVDGDITATDITATDITASGTISASIIKSNNIVGDTSQNTQLFVGGAITASNDVSASNFIGAPIQIVTHAWFSNYAAADWGLDKLTAGDDNFGWADRGWDDAVDKADADAGNGNTGTFTRNDFNKGVRINHDIVDIELVGTLRPNSSVTQLNYYIYKGTPYNGGTTSTITFLASASSNTTTTNGPNDVYITGSTGLQADKGDYIYVFANADLGSGNMKGSYTVTAKTRK